MFTFEAEVRFLHEPNLKEYIESTEKYLRETDYFALNDRDSERYERREEHLRLAKQIYNQHIEDGSLVSYRGKTPYDLDYRIDLRAEKPSLDSLISSAENKKAAIETQVNRTPDKTSVDRGDK